MKKSHFGGPPRPRATVLINCLTNRCARGCDSLYFRYLVLFLEIQ
ncbi:unnamed protein product [Amoebophrya sp. A25]|nr:unnamed protein product [Amoebophrya sp. A25]|eukprot:GSA25T00000301001.1